MKSFTLNEMENIFEIGRAVQALIDKGHIKYYEHKEAFLDSLIFAIAFEKTHADTEDYYWDINMFVMQKLWEKGIM